MPMVTQFRGQLTKGLGGNTTLSSSEAARLEAANRALDAEIAGSGMSARSIAQTTGSSFASQMSSQLTAALDRIYEITERNTARSEAQAAELRDWQERQNQLAMSFNSAEAQKNRDWQQMMSDTAHQREVADLRAAGLNPILSASGGNGAAVTSGATASGVTSSGAKGEVDTSLDGALVNLLGSMWSAQTQLESQRINAQNNLAIAEKNNSSAQLIAQMQTQSQQEVARISGQYNLDIAGINSAVSKLVAQIHAGATVSSSQISAAAYRYATDLGYDGTQLRVAADLISNEAKNRNALQVAGINYDASIGSAGIHASSALDVAKENHLNSPIGFAYTAGNAWQNLLKQITGKSWSSGSRGGGFSR